MITQMAQIPVASAQDFLDALDQHPQFKQAVLRQLLTEGVLTLPERFDRFEEKFDRFVEDNARRHEQTEARFDHFQEEFNQFKTDNARSHERIDKSLENIEDSYYKARVHIKLMARCIAHYDFEEAAEALSPIVPHSLKLQRTVNTAVREGRITPEARAELLLADVIISADQNHHMVAEASLTATDHDITHAADRAEAMRQATGGEVIAAVAAKSIDDRQRELARQLNVEVIITS